MGLLAWVFHVRRLARAVPSQGFGCLLGPGESTIGLLSSAAGWIFLLHWVALCVFGCLELFATNGGRTGSQCCELW